MQHDYEAGVEVRTLLLTEAVEEVDGWMAATDVDATGQRYVKFWIDDARDPLIEEQAAQRMADEADEAIPSREPVSAATLPVFGARSMWSREAHSPDRREGLTPRYDSDRNAAPILGSHGFGNCVSTSQSAPAMSREGLTPRPDAVRRDTESTSSL